MTSITRQLAAELRYRLYSRSLLVVTLLMVAGALASFTGSLSSARAAHEQFVRQVQVFEQNGVRLADALAAPMTVARDATGETIDNPLKYDYLQVGKAVHAVDGVLPTVGTALDLVTFIVIPLTFLVLGASTATVDRRTGTLKLRAARDRWWHITVAKLCSLGVVALLATAVTTVAGALAGLLGAGLLRDLTEQIPYELVDPVSTSPLLLKLGVTVAMATFFGVVGYAIGATTGSTSWPMVLAALALFMLPFLSPWDPRNLLAALAVDTYDFWGQFELRPPLPMDGASALLGLAVYVAVALSLSLLFPRKSRRFS